MKKITISGNEIIIIEANTFYKRFVGLMGKKEIKQNQAMLIKPCSSIHTCFMKFTIDVVFLNKNNIVVDTLENLAPWKLSGNIKDANQVLEMSAGAIKRLNIKKNMKVTI